MAKLTQEDFLSRTQEVWGDRWDYSGTEFTGMKNPVTIRCPEHDVTFTQAARKHLGGQVGCGACGGRRVTSETFILKARAVWGDRWDYSQTEYTQATSPTVFICPEHGSFEQLPNNHLSGKVGCRGCSPRSSLPKPPTPTRKEKAWDSFLAKAREVWGDSLEFVEPKGSSVVVRCLRHGLFEQPKSSVLQGCVGCRGCRVDNTKLLPRLHEMWGERWDFTKTDLLANQKALNTITCPTHGDFVQSLDGLLSGRVGCPKCAPVGTSKAEKELIEFVRAHSPHQVVENDRTTLGGMEMDVYLPDIGVGIEFNGLYFHSEMFKAKNYHYNKWKLASDAGIRLIQVWEDDWRDRKSIIQNHILHVLGNHPGPRIPARKMVVREVGYSSASSFLDSYHIQGAVSGTIYLGGFHEDILVAIAVFLKRRSGCYELVRYATSGVVQGGHSKMVSFFERGYEYKSLVTFADLTFGGGGLYRSTGWEEDGLLPPDYSYIVGGERKHKFGYRISRFKRNPLMKYEEGRTERELAQLNGLLRVYDAGKMRFVKSARQNRPND